MLIGLLIGFIVGLILSLLIAFAMASKMDFNLILISKIYRIYDRRFGIFCLKYKSTIL